MEGHLHLVIHLNSPEILDDIAYIQSATKLIVPKALVMNLWKKTRKTIERAKQNRSEKQTTVVASHSWRADNVARLTAPDVRIITGAGGEIGRAVKGRNLKIRGPPAIRRWRRVKIEGLLYALRCFARLYFASAHVQVTWMQFPVWIYDGSLCLTLSTL